MSEEVNPLLRTIELQKSRIEAGFTDGGHTGPNEAALRESHNAAALAPAKVLIIGDREFLLNKPTNAELMGIRRHLIECVQAGMTTALEASLNVFKRLRAESPTTADGAKDVPFDDEDRKALLEIALATESKTAKSAKSQGKSEPTGRQLEEYMMTLEGIREYLWFRLRGQTPNVSKDWIAANVTDDNMLDIARELGDDTGMTLIDPKSKRD